MGRLNIMSSAYQRLPVTASAVASKRSRSPHWVLVFILGGLVFAGIPNARAAFVTTNEAGLDAVYNQSSFGSDTVDIFFNSTVTFSNGSLLNITTGSQLNTLFAFNDGSPSNVVSIYFVDTLDYCSSFSTAIVGCADVGGNDIVVESVFAAGPSGTELLAHELGHSLDLDHVIFANLMTGVINDNTTLLPEQVATILGNTTVLQMDGSFRFVEVTPVLVTPLPPAGIMFISAILVLLGVHRRKKSGV